MRMSWDVTKPTIIWNVTTPKVERIVREVFEEENLEEYLFSIQVPILKTSFNETETGGC